jgi:hypothetical protein
MENILGKGMMVRTARQFCQGRIKIKFWRRGTMLDKELAGEIAQGGRGADQVSAA